MSGVWAQCADGREHEWVYEYAVGGGPEVGPWAKSCPRCGKVAGASVPEVPAAVDPLANHCRRGNRCLGPAPRGDVHGRRTAMTAAMTEPSADTTAATSSTAPPSPAGPCARLGVEDAAAGQGTAEADGGLWTAHGGVDGGSHERVNLRNLRAEPGRGVP